MLRLNNLKENDKQADHNFGPRFSLSSGFFSRTHGEPFLVSLRVLQSGGYLSCNFDLILQTSMSVRFFGSYGP